MLGSNALFIAGGTAAFGLAVIPWGLRQPTRTRTVIGVAYLCVYTFALVRAGVDRMPLFDALSASERDALAAALQQRELRDGEMVIEQKAGGSLFLIQSGIVSIFRSDADGSTEEISRLGPGDYFGTSMVLTGATRNASVRPLIHAFLFEIGDTDLAPILKAHPELGRELNRAPGRISAPKYHVRYDGHKRWQRAGARPRSVPTRRKTLSALVHGPKSRDLLHGV